MLTDTDEDVSIILIIENGVVNILNQFLIDLK